MTDQPRDLAKEVEEIRKDSYNGTISNGERVYAPLHSSEAATVFAYIDQLDNRIITAQAHLVCGDSEQAEKVLALSLTSPMTAISSAETRVRELEKALRIAIKDIESWHEALDETAGLPPDANVLAELRYALMPPALRHEPQVLSGCAVRAEIQREAFSSPLPAEAQPAATGRTPEQYAIEHGRYLATAAQGFMDACNAVHAAHEAFEDCDDKEEEDRLNDNLEEARENRGEAWKHLQSSIYEFTKRADRAYPLAQPAAVEQQGENNGTV